MKKLVIVVHEDSDLLQFLRKSSKYTKIDDITFMYRGTMNPWDKAAALIATFHPYEFNFYNTSREFRLSIWP